MHNRHEMVYLKKYNNDIENNHDRIMKTTIRQKVKKKLRIHYQIILFLKKPQYLQRKKKYLNFF